VLEAEDLPRLVEGEGEGEAPRSGQLPAAAASAVHSSAAPPAAMQRGSKKQHSPANAGGGDSSLVSPMSIAMGQLGARLAQGGEQQRPDPKPASPRARKHAQR
jgi:hypothetical protein